MEACGGVRPARPAGPLPRRRPSEATTVFEARRESIFAFEDFVDGLDFLDHTERARIKLAGEEIFDNLIRHAGLVEQLVTVRAVRRGDRPYLLFFFKSENFRAYASRCLERGAEHEPAYDRRTRRWRGMGLRMCRHLSLSLSLRPGSSCDRIFIRF